MMIEVGPHPVRVGHMLARAGSDEQALRLQSAIGQRFVGVMLVEREAALETAPQPRQVPCPASVGSEVIAVAQAVASRDALERKIGQRRGGLADREARMAAALEEDHLP